MELALEAKFDLDFIELHGHGDERWPTEVTSNTYCRGVGLARDGRSPSRAWDLEENISQE